MQSRLKIILTVSIILLLWVTIYKKTQKSNDVPGPNTSSSSISINPETGNSQIKRSDSGKTITFKKGETFELSLPGLLEDGDWGNAEFDTSILHLVDRGAFYDDSENITEEIWRFTALKSGSTDISIANIPIAKDHSALETPSIFYKVTIVVQ
jgi:hypothetical protein